MAETPHLTFEKPIHQVHIRVRRAKFIEDGAWFASKRLFVKLAYANQTWKSNKAKAAEKRANWDQSHTFSYTGDNSFEVIVCDTVFWLKDKELGRCSIKVNQAPVRWVPLISPAAEVAGAIELSVKTTSRKDSGLTCSTHSSSQDWAVPNKKDQITLREVTVARDKNLIQAEREEVAKERAEAEKVYAEIQAEFAILQQEQRKLSLQKKILGNRMRKLSITSRRVQVLVSQN